VLLESEIERRSVEYAKSIGIRNVIKLNVIGSVGWPDRVFFKNGRTLFIEFKRPGEQPRPTQVFKIDMLRNDGFQCEVCDSFVQAKQVLDNFLNAV
jgi:hypothetical protein